VGKELRETSVRGSRRQDRLQKSFSSSLKATYPICSEARAVTSPLKNVSENTGFGVDRAALLNHRGYGLSDMRMFWGFL